MIFVFSFDKGIISNFLGSKIFTFFVPYELPIFMFHAVAIKFVWLFTKANEGLGLVYVALLICAFCYCYNKIFEKRQITIHG